MSLPYLALQWTPHTPILFASFVICSALAIAGWWYRDQPATRPFAIMMSGCAFYAGTTVIEYSIVALEPSLFWWRVQYLGWVLIPPATLVFVLEYTGRNRWITPKLFVALAIVPTITLVLAFTPLAPDLIVQNPQVVDEGGIAYMDYDVGPWYTIDGLYSDAVMTIGFVLLVRTYLRTTMGQRSQIGGLVIALAPYATLIPFYYYVGPTVFDFGATYELEPFLYAFTGSIFAWVLFKYRFLDTVPVPFDMMLETTPNGVLIVGTERHVVECNRTAREYLDVAGPIAGRPLRTLSEAAERVDAIIANGGESELRIGNSVYAVSTTRLVDLRGVEYGHHVVIQNVTKRVQYDQLLERHNEQLETLNQMLRHDIRNDTMVALGWTEILDEMVEESSLEADAAPILDRIDTSVRHIADLTEIASELSQPLEQPDEDWTRSISLQRVLREEVEKAAEAFPHAEFTLEEPPDVEVTADMALASAVSNMLRNAVLHNDKEVPTVHISVAIDDGRACVRIADNGPGIPAELQDRIFDRGVKGEHSGGSGLGLHLVQTFLSWYGGSVEMEDNEPEGTVFKIELPIAA
ncbi:histidine kinase N-terminal 7TM domain-containing protein [Natronorubrum sp. DTA28]|uniref:histidine kinase N-terminal 7TM domain-containing protein n=1 Tax=Natronorubrum sp. DTA28 TaxID=3447019 RepID=UPI003F852D8F